MTTFHRAWLAPALFSFACGFVSAQEPKRLTLLEVNDAAQLAQPAGFNPVSTYNAALRFDLDTASDRRWIQATFDRPPSDAEFGFAAVLFELSYEFVVPPFEERRIPDGGAEWPNVWLGYDRLVFDYKNDEPQPVRATVVIQDHISWFPKKYDGLKVVGGSERPQLELPQLYEEEIVLQPGVGIAAIDLRKPLWCNNHRKGLGLDDVKAFGLCLKAPDRKVVVGVNRFRLEARDQNAGAFSYPQRAHCPSCGKGTSDRYAPFCPFCSAEMKACEPFPKELPKFPDDALLLKAIDAGGGGTNDGNGGDVTDRLTGPTASQALRHYDLYYNRPKGSAPLPDRKRLPWEYRSQLKFALGDEFAAKPKIKRATLWVAANLKLKELPEPAFCQKPWLPGVLIFSIDEAYDGWNGKEVSFNNLCPYERLLYVGGQHPGPATQNPKLKVAGFEAPNCLPLEITEFVQEAVDGGRKTFSLGLRVFTPKGATPDPHGYGHTMNFFGLGSEKSPVIVVELTK